MIKVAAVLETASNMFSPYHYHKDLEINHFLSGEGVYRVLDKEYEIREGDTFVFNHNEIHRITHIASGIKMRILKIHFNPELLWDNSNHIFGYDYLNIFFDRAEGFENKLPANSRKSVQIGDIIQKMYQEQSKKEDKYKTMLKIHLLNILVLLIRHYNLNEQDKNKVHKKNYSQIIKITQYINEHFTDDIHLDDLVKMACMSKNTLMKLFKDFNGISVYSYIVSKRINFAVDMLLKEDKSITDIAYECGFNNTVSFNKMFKKITGHTPSEIKKMHTK